MTERVRKTKTSDRASSTSPESTREIKSGDKLKADLDDLLDEIDGVLESNAEEFVKNYVQKGGQ